MKYVKAVLVFLALIIPSLVHATLEPAGSVQIARCDMSTTAICNAVKNTVAPGRWYDLYSSAVIGSDGSEPISPPGFLDSAMYYSGPCNNGGGSPLGCANGGTQVGYIDNKADRELYARFSFKINSSYGCSLVGKSKVFFMRSFDFPFGFERSNGVFLIEGCGTTKSMMFSHNSGNLDNSHTCSLDLGLACFPNVGSAAIPAGQWVTVEACIRASSSLTSRDGVLWWAINGVMSGRYTNFNYGSGNINEWVQNETWDGYGNGQGFTTDVHQMFGDVYVSVPPNGGCASVAGGGGTTPPGDTTPPGRASGLVITQLN